MDIYTTTIAVSIVVYIAIGNYAGRGIKRLDDYFVAGRRAPTLVIVGTLIASYLSTGLFLGDAGFAYDGQAGPWILFPATISAGYCIGAILFGRYLRRSRASTVADFFGRRFNSRRLQALAGYTIILGLGGYLLAVTQGGALLLSQLTDLSYLQAIVVFWLGYSAFTMYAGSRGVILTDTLMFLLFTFASIAAIFFVVDQFGGWSGIVEQLVAVEEKAGLLSWHGIIGPGTDWATATDYLIWILVVDISWLVAVAVSPWQASRHLMAKNEHVVLRAAIIANIALAILVVMVYGMAGVINLAKTDIYPSANAMIWASMNLLPAFLGALMLAGITAAALSSASTFLSLVGFSASNDIGIHTSDDEAKKLRFSRLMMLLIGAIAPVAGLLTPPNIFWITIYVGTIFASSWGPVAIMSIWSKRITESAAFWGMLAGAAFNVFPLSIQYFGLVSLPSYLEPALIGATASLIVILFVSRYSSVSEAEATYRRKLHETPPEEISSGKTRKTLWAAAALLVANGIIMPWLLVTYYVRPYQRATGTLLSDGSLDWFTGEAILAMSWSVVYVCLGLVAFRVIRKEYAPA